MLVTLCLEVTTQVGDFLLGDFVIQWNKEIGNSKVTIIFWNFILQYQVASKRVPRQIREHAMILMTVISIMGEDQVRLKSLLETFKILLDLFVLSREKAGSKPLYHNLFALEASDELTSTPLCLQGPPATGAENYPLYVEIRPFSRQLQKRPSAANLNVVAVSSKTKHFLETRKVEADHGFDVCFVKFTVLVTNLKELGDNSWRWLNQVAWDGGVSADVVGSWLHNCRFRSYSFRHSSHGALPLV